ncbi:uncharacterized protein LOC144136257 isoform X1 [Amblyomma americanum]
MAVDGVPIIELTARQTDLVIGARLAGAAHVYYTNGWDIRKKGTEVISPSLLWQGHKWTVVFYNNLGVQSGIYGFTLGQYNHHRKTYVTLYAGTEWTVQYVFEKNSKNIKRKKVNTPIQGFHVLEFKRTSAGPLEMYLDGEILHEKNQINTDKLQDFRVLYTDQGGKSDFIFWEMHYRPTNLTTEWGPNEYRFIHNNLSIGMGGYALFQGTWKATELHVMGESGSLGKVNATGKLGLMLRVYKDGYAVCTTTGTSTFSKTTNSHAIPMKIGCTKAEKMDDVLYRFKSCRKVQMPALVVSIKAWLTWPLDTPSQRTPNLTPEFKIRLAGLCFSCFKKSL